MLIVFSVNVLYHNPIKTTTIEMIMNMHGYYYLAEISASEHPINKQVKMPIGVLSKTEGVPEYTAQYDKLIERATGGKK